MTKYTQSLISHMGQYEFKKHIFGIKEIEACNDCGEDHDPEDCSHGFNEPYGGSVELYDIEREKELA